MRSISHHSVLVLTSFRFYIIVACCWGRETLLCTFVCWRYLYNCMKRTVVSDVWNILSKYDTRGVSYKWLDNITGRLLLDLLVDLSVSFIHLGLFNHKYNRNSMEKHFISVIFIYKCILTISKWTYILGFGV